ncbi:hypothetical protein BGZ65_000239 [Modicella reniformis]|uniref:Uncharacterized protein n=1 Tax=Modicella reniformis TaxID=1440133 RepID=A0A9P6M1C2_9FUNG|nr:hypothetical protein BGZ65_000239 [Modicella reniformis]
MSVGKSHELTTFCKANVLEKLDLPSEHLQLTAILTKNDYFSGIYSYGIKSNVVRNITLDQGTGGSDVEATTVKTKSVEDYRNALRHLCFVERTDPKRRLFRLEQICAVCEIFRQLEDAKLRRRRMWSKRATLLLQQAVQPIGLYHHKAMSMYLRLSQTVSGPNVVGIATPQLSSEQEKEEEMYKIEKGQSPNLDKNPRYSAKIVKDLTKASPTLKKLTTLNLGLTNRREQATKSDKRLRVLHAVKVERITESQRGTERIPNVFGKAFKTSTLTLGCLTETLKRATTMNQEKARIVADRLDEVVHVLSKTRIFVFRGIVSTSRKDRSRKGQVMKSSAIASQDSEIEVIEDPLDLLLDKKHGETLMAKIGRPEDTIPVVEQSESDNDDLDANANETGEKTDENEAEDSRYSFMPGYIQVFVTTAGYPDTFHRLSEAALLSILWGDKNDKEPHPIRAIMVRHLCSHQEAEQHASNSYGQLLFRLFVGDRMQQTPYGKRIITMATLAIKDQAFDIPALQRYVDSYFAYL